MNASAAIAHSCVGRHYVTRLSRILREASQHHPPGAYPTTRQAVPGCSTDRNRDAGDIEAGNKPRTKLEVFLNILLASPHAVMQRPTPQPTRHTAP